MAYGRMLMDASMLYPLSILMVRTTSEGASGLSLQCMSVSSRSNTSVFLSWQYSPLLRFSFLLSTSEQDGSYQSSRILRILMEEHKCSMASEFRSDTALTSSEIQYWLCLLGEYGLESNPRTSLGLGTLCTRLEILIEARWELWLLELLFLTVFTDYSLEIEDYSSLWQDYCQCQGIVRRGWVRRCYLCRSFFFSSSFFILNTFEDSLSNANSRLDSSFVLSIGISTSLSQSKLLRKLLRTLAAEGLQLGIPDFESDRNNLVDVNVALYRQGLEEFPRGEPYRLLSLEVFLFRSMQFELITFSGWICWLLGLVKVFCDETFGLLGLPFLLECQGLTSVYWVGWAWASVSSQSVSEYCGIFLVRSESVDLKSILGLKCLIVIIIINYVCGLQESRQPTYYYLLVPLSVLFPISTSPRRPLLHLLDFTIRHPQPSQHHQAQFNH